MSSFSGITCPKIERRNPLPWPGAVVVGTTLSTHSSFRLVEESKKNGGTVVAVNLGSLVKGSNLVDLQIEARASEVLMQVALSARLLLPRV